jgi:hypothetical protein
MASASKPVKMLPRSPKGRQSTHQVRGAQPMGVVRSSRVRAAVMASVTSDPSAVLKRAGCWLSAAWYVKVARFQSR